MSTHSRNRASGGVSRAAADSQTKLEAFRSQLNGMSDDDLAALYHQSQGHEDALPEEQQKALLEELQSRLPDVKTRALQGKAKAAGIAGFHYVKDEYARDMRGDFGLLRWFSAHSTRWIVPCMMPIFRLVVLNILVPRRMRIYERAVIREDAERHSGLPVRQAWFCVLLIDAIRSVTPPSQPTPP